MLLTPNPHLQSENGRIGDVMGPFTIQSMCSREQVSTKKAVPAMDGLGLGHQGRASSHCCSFTLHMYPYIEMGVFLRTRVKHPGIFFSLPFYPGPLFKNNTCMFCNAEGPAEETKKLATFWPIHLIKLVFLYHLPPPHLFQAPKPLLPILGITLLMELGLRLGSGSG